MKLERSMKLLEDGLKVIPGATQTFSKGFNQFVEGVSPVYLERGKGSHVWDVDGNEYIDYIIALLPNILGYSYEAVNEAVRNQLEKGVSFSLPHPLEIQLAEKLIELIPCAEMVKFGKTGSDATSAAVRAARAYTEKDVILYCGYHGWHDWHIGATSRNLGVPKAVSELTKSFVYNDIENLSELFETYKDQVAAVIMEPMNFFEPKAGYLQQVKDLCHQNDSLLIFDEIITGFRFSLGGAQEIFGVLPDLATYSKVLANGFPLSAVVGSRKVMEIFTDIFYSLTFGGETLSLAAAIATLHELETKNVIEHIHEQGQRIKDFVNQTASDLGIEDQVQCIGRPCFSLMKFSDSDGKDSIALRGLFQQEVVSQGILFLTTNNLSYGHSKEDVDKTMEAYGNALEVIKTALAEDDIGKHMLGKPIQPIFSIRRT
ncbi:MAG: aminotransferase class III-fold pyridoxal phosphate-dependent enzyme [Planctomycetes bacterium]|nr:aminotransferase class III-fold pyridoxal phosphate-dependent enzyme [Planctomycetota bacterium]